VLGNKYNQTEDNVKNNIHLFTSLKFHEDTRQLLIFLSSSASVSSLISTRSQNRFCSPKDENYIQTWSPNVGFLFPVDTAGC
jgi:hypothetical protein